MAGLFKKVFMPKETTPLDAQGRLVPSYANYLGAIEPMSAALSAFDPDTFEADILAAVTTATAFLQNRAIDVNTTAFNTTTALPIDGTVPQITEGDGVCSLSITPTSATGRIRVQFEGLMSGRNAADAVGGAALFINGAAAAVAATAAVILGTGSVPVNPTSEFSLLYEYVPGVTTAQTIAVRMGGSSPAGFRVNGMGGATNAFGTAGGSTLIASQITA